MSVNRVILIGRFGKDPELKELPNNNVCNFSLATSRSWKDKDGNKAESTTWHNCVAWGKQADIINEYCSKGEQIYVEGRIDNRSYEDKDGNKKYISEVVVENFRFIGTKSEDSDKAEAPRITDKWKDKDGNNDDGLPF